LLKLLLVFFFSALLAIGCNTDGRKSFDIEVEHYNGANGITLKYSLNQDKIDIITNCDLANCKEEKVYTRLFSKTESDSINNFLKSLKLDTLKLQPASSIKFDGHNTKITFKKHFILTLSSSINYNNYTTPTTDTLFKYIENLIFEQKYQFRHWGE